MSNIPQSVKDAWKEKEGPVVLTTVNKKGIPNSIYATCTEIFGEEYFVVADNYFSKTRENLKAGTEGSLLFITKEGKSFQIKGTVEYITEGEIFDDMKTWNPKEHPGHAAAAVKVDEIFSGAEKIL
jgi:predicted pyridoxine 5'-phosphate oxidase superfamily flavin-nucleotide-binding protein